MKKIFLFILFCLSVCSMSAYDFLRAVKDEIPGGYNFWVYTPVDYFYSQEHTSSFCMVPVFAAGIWIR